MYREGVYSGLTVSVCRGRVWLGVNAMDSKNTERDVEVEC